MSKKIKISVEFKNLVESCMAYYDAKTELSETRAKYDERITELSETITNIDGRRMKKVVEMGMTWDEACVGDLSKERYDKLLDAKEAVESDLLEATRPINGRINAYANSIATVEGLYNAYVIAMQKGDWDATGFYRTGRDKLVNVNTSFRDSILSVMRKYGCGINAKSGRTCEDTIFVRLGGRSTKDGFRELTKRQFVNLFVDCVLQYMIDTNQL